MMEASLDLTEINGGISRGRGHRGNESIYLHRSGPLLENGLDRPKNRYGRYGLAKFFPAFPYLP